VHFGACLFFLSYVLVFCKTKFQIGDQVCVKRSVAEPRYAWGGETHHSVGKIIDIESDGLLIIDIPNRAAPWQADPSDMEKIENFKV
jgi:E3 ubiquitin-protein ligase KEG